MRAKGDVIDIVCEAASPRRAIQNAKPSLSPQVSKSPVPSDRPRTASQHGATFQLVITLAHCADWTLVRFFKVATASESSGDEFGILEDDRCIDKEFSNIASSCTSWSSLAAHPRRRVHRSVTPSCPRRLVRYLGSCSVRVGPPSCRQNQEVASTRKLVTRASEVDSERSLRTGLGQTRLLALGCSRCRHSSSGESSSARRSLLARTRGDPPDWACARTWLSGLGPSSFCPEQPFVLVMSSCSLRVRMSWKRKSSWTADAMCRLDADFAFLRATANRH